MQEALHLLPLFKDYMKQIALAFICMYTLVGCTGLKKNSRTDFNKIAEQYVRLGLTIGQYDPDFVDAYYGPDSLQPKAIVVNNFPKDSLLAAVNELQKAAVKAGDNSEDSITFIRAKWMQTQLTAFSRRIKIASGEYADFDIESKELFGAEAPHNTEAYFVAIEKELDSLMPGKGSLTDRMTAFTKNFIIPKEKIDTIFKVSIEEARKRTLSHFTLPAGETFTLEYVTNKPWGGYNWYKGNYKSVIQINTDLPIYIERAIDLACHEGYPGHHVFNALLEKNLYRDKGWVEISLYPLFSPQSFIAEGSANYGIEVAFPGNEKNVFAKEVLFPLAGLDPSKADAYFKVLELKSKLNYARNEAARGHINGTLKEIDAINWLTNYSLMTTDAANKSLSFIKKYRSYVINYNYGQDMVKEYIEKNGGTSDNPAKRWTLFEWLLSNVVTPDELKGKTK